MEFPIGRDLAAFMTENLGPRWTKFLVRFGAFALVVWLCFFLLKTIIEGVALFEKGPITETAGGILVVAFAAVLLLMFMAVIFSFMVAVAVKGIQTLFWRRDIREMRESIAELQKAVENLQGQLTELQGQSVEEE